MLLQQMVSITDNGLCLKIQGANSEDRDSS